MNRDAIFQALFDLVSSSASFKTSSRRLKLWADVNASQKPAIFVAQRQQTYARNNDTAPARVTLKADIFIYTNAGKDPNVVGATQLNDLVDAVDKALKGDVRSGIQTLGGLVTRCWIEGDIIFDAGDLDGDGIAVIPVTMLVA